MTPAESVGVKELVDFWSCCDLHNPPHLHPEDKERLGSLERRFDFLRYDFQSFISSRRFGNFKDHRFHLSLLPVPYTGAIGRADIVILQLNPGLSFSDFYAEYQVPFFRDLRKRSLRQDLDQVEFPFITLDPEYCWHPGFSYWERKFRKILSEFASKENCSYRSALKELSQRLLCLELFPYHSPEFGSNIKELMTFPRRR